jgi:sialidase-1
MVHLKQNLKMKKCLFVFLSFVFSSVGWGQKLISEEFHTHRGELYHSFVKFEKTGEGRVAFLGGSITYNPGWRDSVGLYFQTQFPETRFDFINAGVPSMGSTPGAFRFEKEVLKNGKVDLLFLEAAVNDKTNGRSAEEIIRGMEGIVRHAKRANPDCNIVLMYFVDPEKMEDYNKGKVPEVIQLHEKVAVHYNISSINLAKEVTERINRGEFSWEEDFVDLHPSPFGQQIYFRSIKSFLETEQNRKPADSKVGLPEPLDKHAYSAGVLVEVNPPKSIKGWTFDETWNPADGAATRFNYVDVPMLVGDFPGKVLKFPFKGDAVGIAVVAGPDAGIIEYSIDESQWKKADLFTPWSKNLYLPWFVTLGSGLKNRKHTLQIRVSNEKNPESTGTSCIIKYFYFNRGE